MLNNGIDLGVIHSESGLIDIKYGAQQHISASEQQLIQDLRASDWGSALSPELRP